MSPDEAERVPRPQIASFAGTAADLVTALTLTYADEAIGIVRAAQAAEMPVAISFTVETDGRLPERRSRSATRSRQVDAQTGGAPRTS